MKQIFASLLVLTFATSCGQETTNSNKELDADTPKTVVNESTDISPCSLISEADLNKILAIPEGKTLDMEDKQLTYPTCIYKWEEWTFSETKTFSGTSVNIDYPSEVLVVFVKNASKSMFETSTKAYRDGVAVSGVGEMAMWGDILSQLTFLANGSMIHVHVKTSTDATLNKENAIKIAKKMIANL
jgi:hypothetical protein